MQAHEIFFQQWNFDITKRLGLESDVANRISSFMFNQRTHVQETQTHDTTELRKLLIRVCIGTATPPKIRHTLAYNEDNK